MLPATSLPATSLPTQIPVRVRFPNRYTGGYDASTATDKLRWQTIASVKRAPLTRNSDMGSETVVGRRVYGPPPESAPGAPTNLSVVYSGSTATVSWTASSGTVLTYTVIANPGAHAVVISAPTTSATLTGLTPGLVYTFTVVATNAQGSSSSVLS
jgi:hypothetical protein